MSRNIGDQMHEAAFAKTLTIDQRLERLDGLSTEAAGMAIAATSDAATPGARLLGLQSGTWLACEPSLIVTAKRESHDRSVAAAVCDNLQHLFGQVLEYEATSSIKSAANQSTIEGYLAEMSVLGLLSWGAANTAWEKYSILPATSWQDGRTRKHGFKRSADIIISEGLSIRQRVQVKRSDKPFYRVSNGRRIPYYQPGIPLLSPAGLTGEKREYATLFLMDALVRDDQQELTWAGANAEIAIQAAHEHREEYYLKRYGVA